MYLEISDKRIINFMLYNDKILDRYNKMTFILKDLIVDVGVDINTDELIFSTRTISAIDPIRNSVAEIENEFKSVLVAKTVGKTIGFYWIAANNKGYVDLLALDIDDVVPNLIFSCVASLIVIRYTTNEGTLYVSPDGKLNI